MAPAGQCTIVWCDARRREFCCTREAVSRRRCPTCDACCAATAWLRQRYFREIGFRLVGVHKRRDPAAAIAAAEAIIVGGGNTFRLLKAMHELDLVDAIREAVGRGVPYFGSSAGANVAGLSIRTTNDMPIVQPPRLDALGLLPFQINPHYIDSPPDAVGETRQLRLLQFLEENDVAVIGLREGSWLVVNGDVMKLRGGAGAVLMRRGRPLRRLKPGADLSPMLRYRARFDDPAPVS
jgi:dipeptidase E